MNIIEVTNTNDFKKVVNSNITVIVGFTLASTPKKLKIFIRKFLKQQSLLLPLITFVYMEVGETERTISILHGDNDVFPKIYHIRDRDKIMVEVVSATPETIIESFNAVKQLYIDEMTQQANSKKNEQIMKQKVEILNKTSKEVHDNLINDIIRRKKLETQKN